jgi:HAE1 family hydrophobic/amphiphilic exporter-1
MNLSTWAIKNPIPPILLFILMTVAGLFAFEKLAITNMPNVVRPVVTVRLTQPSALPSEIETQITSKVEHALAAIQGVRHITSTVLEGISITTVDFQLDTNVDRAVNDTRDAVASIRNQLPSTMDEPLIQRQAEEKGAVLIYSVEAPSMRTEELSWYIDDSLSRALLGIPGVAKVSRSGGTGHEITVTMNPARLGAFGITAADVSKQLASTNVDVPGGRITLAGTEYSLRTSGNADTVRQLESLHIALPNGSEVKLGDLGKVEDGGAETRTITRIDGRPAVTFSVFRSVSASEVTVAHKVEARLAEIDAARGDVSFRQIFSQATMSERGVRATLFTFVEGALLTVLVVFVFLRDIRATLICAVAIPLSIIPTFLCMQWLGFTLNLVSCIAISLVTGVLVDDAIVEIENIHRHMRDGKSARQAAIGAVEEIGLAVVATTLVICAVFIPVGLMPGLAGQYFKQFGLTIGIAALFSLLVARLLTPMLAAALLTKPKVEYRADGPWLRRYERVVEWTLNHRVVTMIAAVVTVIGSFALVPLLPSGFMPYQDFSLSSLSIELPRGSTIEQTDEAAQRVARILRERSEVEYVMTTTGSEFVLSDAMGGPNQARVITKLRPPDQRELNERQFANAMFPQLAMLPDVRVRFDNATGKKDISIALVSDDATMLTRIAEQIEREMRELPGLTSVGTNSGQRQPEIVISVDSVRAAQLGITAQQIGEAINVSTIGDNDVRLAQFNYPNRQIPIRVRLPRDPGRDLGAIENLKLQTALGASVPLSTIATIGYGAGPTTIERYDRQRKIKLEANLSGIALGTALEAIYGLPAMKNLPPNVSVLNTGDAELMKEFVSGVLAALVGGLLMVYVVQVLLYRDWLQPITRMAALPMCIGGAFLLLYLTNTEIGLPASIGILMLMGIVDKNSILLVDHILEGMRQGVPRRQAILEGCRVRARPIVMTSAAMLAGMLPTALGVGIDTAFRTPMAIAVIGGLLSSTALTLIFMPVLFSYVRDFEEWIAIQARRLLPTQPSEAEEQSMSALTPTPLIVEK